MNTQPILAHCKRRLSEHYGPRLAGVLLYGSEARGEAGEASDIDLLVLLRGTFDYFDELRAIVDILYPVQLEANRHLSAKPACLTEYENGRLQLYRNAKREGVPL